jgi:hypothetical protein
MGDLVRFRSIVEPWTPGATGGLMIALVPEADARTLGGLRQVRVSGTINGAAFTSNVMPRGGGRLALSVSKAMLTAARARPGGEIDVEMSKVEKDVT